MAGIYLHIPFCKRACHYCNFHFSTTLRLKNDFLDALLKEIELQKDYLGTESVETIYFGGGTPSLLTANELQRILSALGNTFNIAPGAEVTLEANPDDITASLLSEWRGNGVNRLSIGIQSFFEEDLQWMNRAHTARQAIDQLELALQQFDNMTIDLIYGTPTLSDERWQENVQRALSLKIPHLSCYALTVEPKTALDKMIQKHQVSNVQPDDQARQFLLLMDWAGAAGYEHYEISNFALPGHRSRHNSSYWQGKKYLGLGPSAHSFDGKGRQWNIANNALYIQSLVKGTVPFEEEILTADQRLNEYIMISLRTMEGLNLEQVKVLAGEKVMNEIHRQSLRYIDQQLLTEKHNRLTLTKQGKLFADRMAGDLFV
ncbi:radical SAM family heme chaperone HemW [Paraflavitalea sp. CAU 1676]|uniref:radical SAM family heme chaperone HemW n=1 Tax=Paraflavitalea sp. CAU 1676 TaxID=3032598 RepID=UPI0023DCA9A1|nr:radical SAM family heme chaperone HemW [Paraflavitalea sp. CAU 1676]MDF2187202.1 radical SAM family heme chaperone HemW [Paraflavitalea sp. CAU 1676]